MCPIFRRFSDYNAVWLIRIFVRSHVQGAVQEEQSCPMTSSLSNATHATQFLTCAELNRCAEQNRCAKASFRNQSWTSGQNSIGRRCIGSFWASQHCHFLLLDLTFLVDYALSFSAR